MLVVRGQTHAPHASSANSHANNTSSLVRVILRTQANFKPNTQKHPFLNTYNFVESEAIGEG